MVEDQNPVVPNSTGLKYFDPNVRLGDLSEKGYRFLDRIGKGCMTYVYQIESSNIKTPLAIKIFRRRPFENKRTLKRLEQEATKAKQLSHANLCSVYEFGVSARQYPYLVMDFLQGPTLEQIIRTEGFLDVDRVVDMVIQICDALSHAHDLNIVHRDLKPANIYLLPVKRNEDLVKVSDFGIAKILPNPGRETRYMTADGEEFGNPSYMSPEQCLGERLDARSDIYSLGCLTYEALTGKLPLSSNNAVQLAYKQLNQKPRSLRERFKDIDIPESLDSIVMCALEKKPEARFASAAKLKEALETMRGGKKPKLPTSQPVKRQSLLNLLQIGKKIE